MTTTPVTIADLTAASLDGAGVFDVLMRAHKAHLDEQFTKGRIKGPEYATVYLGMLESAMQGALAFLASKTEISLKADLLEKQIALAEQQRLNAVTEGTVLTAQEAKTQAEILLLGETQLKTVEEKALLVQKTATELAQTRSTGVDDNSVVGKQKILYQAQADGFANDNKQKVAKIMVDSWNVRRTTDEATVADSTNKLDDASVGSAVAVLLASVGA